MKLLKIIYSWFKSFAEHIAMSEELSALHQKRISYEETINNLRGDYARMSDKRTGMGPSTRIEINRLTKKLRDVEQEINDHYVS